VNTNEKTAPVKKKKWTFLRKVRWAFISIYLAFMAFFAICVTVGIITNIHWRQPSLDIPSDRPESLSDIGPLELKNCLSELEKMHTEMQDQVLASMSGKNSRESTFQDYTKWSKDWRLRYEKLGISCRLNELQYRDHPSLGLLADIYRLIDYFQRTNTKFVKRFVTENAQPLQQMTALFAKAKDRLEGLND
jgi:hypothetical protein